MNVRTSRDYCLFYSVHYDQVLYGNCMYSPLVTGWDIVSSDRA
jgi:hypothetical protein